MFGFIVKGSLIHAVAATDENDDFIAGHCGYECFMDAESEGRRCLKRYEGHALYVYDTIADEDDINGDMTPYEIRERSLFFRLAALDESSLHNHDDCADMEGRHLAGMAGGRRARNEYMGESLER